jgi:hypothetical protein
VQNKPEMAGKISALGGGNMQERTIWETIRLQGNELIESLKRLIQEGNARRIVIKQEDRIVAEFPLTAGVVGALVAPILAAIGALIALLKDCSIEVEKVVSDSADRPLNEKE